MRKQIPSNDRAKRKPVYGRETEIISKEILNIMKYDEECAKSSININSTLKSENANN